MQELSFTPDQLYAQAQGNANALTLATVIYLKEHGLAVADWATAVGRQFARGWTGEVGPARAAWGMARNVASLGGQIVGQNGDDANAEIKFTDFPPPEMLAMFNVTRAESDAVFGWITAGVMEELGLRAEWQRDGDQVTLRIAHQGDALSGTRRG